MKKLVVFILATALISCSSKRHEDLHRFEEFVHNLPSRQLPINFSCGLPNEFGTGNVESSELSEFAEFIPQNQNLIFGIVGRSEEFTLVIYGKVGDDIYPTLYSYNNFGKRIDSLFLIRKACGGADELSIPTSFVQIDKDLKVILTDTTEFIHYVGDGIHVLDSSKVSSAHYTVDKTGRIIKN